MILSHRMDGLFSRNDIRFDYAHGVYYPKVDSNRCIIVEANDEVLLHWTTNALNRHGYALFSHFYVRDGRFAILTGIVCRRFQTA